MANERKVPRDMAVLDKEDRHMQKTANKQKDPANWIRGWNKVKYKQSSTEKVVPKRNDQED